MIEDYTDGALNQEVDQQLGQINYNIENISANSANTGKTESGGSDNDEKKNENFGNTGALDDMEDEEERYQEYKAPETIGTKGDDLTKDLAMAQKTHGYRARDRLYSTSGVIIEGPVIK